MWVNKGGWNPCPQLSPPLQVCVSCWAEGDMSIVLQQETQNRFLRKNDPINEAKYIKIKLLMVLLCYILG